MSRSTTLSSCAGGWKHWPCHRSMPSSSGQAMPSAVLWRGTRSCWASSDHI